MDELGARRLRIGRRASPRRGRYPATVTVVASSIARFAALVLLVLPAVAQEQPLDGFVRSPWFGEQVCVLQPADGVHMLINAPRELRADRPLRVVLFATPNGNTILQTLGCRAAPGLDWHYDIQHVAAQIRRLREIAPEEDVVLVCVQADGLSWPAWRAKHGGGGAGVRAIVGRALAALPGGDGASVELCAHSGGGSFLFGFLEDGDEIPAFVRRIAFLDANYSYSDDQGHGRELLAWLRRSETNRLIVLAYDDREVEFRGKKIVGPTGGTFRASQRMLDAFGKAIPLEQSRDGELELAQGLGGRFTVLRRLNPENKILHTALVGDMNGLLWALTLGGTHATEWGTFGGPRAYDHWIQPVPGTGAEPNVAPAAPPRPLPPRPSDAPGGHAVMAAVEKLSLFDREARILAEIDHGNVPDFLRHPVSIELDADDRDGKRHHVRYRVAPDYLAVGSDADFVRVPLTPMSAQRVLDRYGFALPTRQMVVQIHAHAAVKLEPHPLGEPRQAVATFVTHDGLIEAARAGQQLGLLVDGVKKDVVITPRLAEQPGKVAIFGWHHPGGEPIQPLYTGHIATYVDYSHGIRLVQRDVEVDGAAMALADVLADSVLCTLLSDEGPVPPACQRYRTW